MIKRKIEQLISREIIDKTNNAIIVYGARQVGKTTMIENIFAEEEDVIWLNGDSVDTIQFFDNYSNSKFSELIETENIKFLIIDEAQRIENIGLKLKIIHDNFKNRIKIIATGSSSFDLANKINEPLTGRTSIFNMFPLKTSEMISHHGLDAERISLNTRLKYGYYPNVVTSPGKEREILKWLVGSNLYKDIFTWANIQRSEKLISLLKALAYQVGSQVKINEIAQLVDLSPHTVEKYINLLEQSFIIFNLSSFSRNLRNELKASQKYYFYDVGIRNAIINNFNEPTERGDIGGLFENFIIAELIKKNSYPIFGNAGNFWRTQNGQEIDYVKEEGGGISVIEIKWNPNAKARIPKSFVQKYNPSDIKIIHRDNFWEVL